MNERLCINCKHYLNDSLTIRLFPTDKDGLLMNFENYCDMWHSQIPSENIGKTYCWKFEDKNEELCENCKYYLKEYTHTFYSDIGPVTVNDFCLWWNSIIPCFDGFTGNDIRGCFCCGFKKKEESQDNE